MPKNYLVQPGEHDRQLLLCLDFGGAALGEQRKHPGQTFEVVMAAVGDPEVGQGAHQHDAVVDRIERVGRERPAEQPDVKLGNLRRRHGATLIERVEIAGCAGAAPGLAEEEVPRHADPDQRGVPAFGDREGQGRQRQRDAQAALEHPIEQRVVRVVVVVNVRSEAVGAKQPGAQAGRIRVAVDLGQAVELAGDLRRLHGGIGVHGDGDQPPFQAPALGGAGQFVEQLM